MKRMSGECKRFVVQCLACFMSPSEVAEAVNIQFGIRLNRQQIHFYDPTGRAGAQRLSQSLRDLFTVTRQRFISSADDVGMAHLAYRLRCLSEIYRRAVERGNDWLAMKALEQAAKEVGGWYVRKDGTRQPQREATARLLAMSSATNLDDWKAAHKKVA
jgi:hypothetical protein